VYVPACETVCVPVCVTLRATVCVPVVLACVCEKIFMCKWGGRRCVWHIMRYSCVCTHMCADGCVTVRDIHVCV